MKQRTWNAATAVMLLASVASAQPPQATTQGSSNPMIKSSEAQTTAAPSEGANSFTQSQARKRMEKAGYKHVSSLTKDDSGLWQGTAMRDGQKVRVALDYKGNVSPR